MQGGVIKENLNDSLVATFVTVDKDRQESFTYTLIEGNASFVFDDNKLITSRGLDFEAGAKITIIVTSADRGGETVKKTFEIEITDANDPPTTITFVNNTGFLFENATNGTDVGAFDVIDQDKTDSHTFRVTSPAQQFSIINNRLVFLDFGSPSYLNYEQANETTVVVRCTDSGTPPQFTDIRVTVAVLDSNDVPSINSKEIFINETSEIGSVAGTIDVDDEDSLTNKPWLANRKPQQHIITMVPFDGDGGDLDLFYRNLTSNPPVTTNGVDVVVNGTLDHEIRPVFVIIVFVSDSNNPNATSPKTNVVVNVGDQPEAPTHVNLTTMEMYETIPTSTTRVGDVFGQVVVYDEDVDSFDVQVVFLGVEMYAAATSCSVITGVSLFNSTGEREWMKCTASLIIARPLLYTGAKTSTKSIIIGVSDNVGFHLAPFNITILNVNEAPTDLFVSATSVNENARQGVFVGELYAADPDIDDTIRFKIVNETDSSPFAIVGGTDLVVQRPDQLDFETNPFFTLEIEVIDSGHPPLSDSFLVKIEVVDVNEAPNTITLSPNTIAEDGASYAAIVGRVIVGDPDNVKQIVQTHKCSLDDASGTFFIDGSNNIRVMSATVDFERISAYTDLFITCQDNGIPKLSFSTTLTIEITDVNEAPTAISLSAATVSENLPIGVSIGQLTTTDPDNGRGYANQLSFQYAVIANNDDEFVTEAPPPPFAVDSDGYLVTTAVLDFEVQSNYTFNINVSDEGGLWYIEQFVVKVLDENDVPSAVTPTVFTVNEAEFGAVVGTLFTEDQDAGQSHSYKLIDVELNDGAKFQIQENRLSLLESFAANYEQARLMVCVVQTTDSGNPARSFSQTVWVRVHNSNEQPIEFVLHDAKGENMFSVFENASMDRMLGVVAVIDPDNSRSFNVVEDDDTIDIDQNHSCSVLAWSDIVGLTQFHIDSDLSLTMTEAPLDYESIGNRFVSINLTCVDDGRPPMKLTSQLEFRVVNVNEVPTSIALNGVGVTSVDGIAIAENQPLNAIIGDLSVSDPDNCNEQWCFPHQKHTISVISSASNAFSIKDNHLIALDPLNFEAMSTFTLTFVVEDNGEPSLTSTFVANVTVLDRNDRPHLDFIGRSRFSPSDVAGYVVGTLVVHDEDESTSKNGSHTFGFAPAQTPQQQQQQQQAMEYLEIVENKLVLKSYPTSSKPQIGTTFYLSLVAYDGGTPSLSGTTNVAILVADLNRSPSNISTPSTLRVPENSKDGTVVATIQVADPDNLNCNLPCVPQSHTCQAKVIACVENNAANTNNATIACRLNGDGDGDDDDFASLEQPVGFQGLNLVVLSHNMFDFESISQFEVEIVCTDSGTPPMSLKKAVNVSIVDTNDAPSNVRVVDERGHEVDVVQVSENALEGALVGTFLATDQDVGQTHIFQLSPKSLGRTPFIVVGNQLLVHRFEGAVLDYEVHPFYDVEILVTDSGVPLFSMKKTITVLVVDVNEPVTEVLLRCGCRHNPCLNNGACFQRDNSQNALDLTCNCSDGFTGSECEKSISTGSISQRSLGRQCLDLSSKLRKGDQVAKVIVIDGDLDQMHTISIQSNAFTIRNSNEIYLSQEVDKTTTPSTLQADVVVRDLGGYSLSRSLQFVLSPCVFGSNCDSNAKCVDGQPDLKVTKCLCNRGFQGNGTYCKRLNCSEHTVEQRNECVPLTCDPSPCENEAQCVGTGDSRGVFCDCRSGFGGKLCSHKINQCDPNPCQSGAGCFEGKSRAAPFECRCSNMSTGSDMTSDITTRSDLTGYRCQFNSSVCREYPCPSETQDCIPKAALFALTQPTANPTVPPSSPASRLCTSQTTSTMLKLNDDGICATVTNNVIGDCGKDYENITMADFELLFSTVMLVEYGPSGSNVSMYPIGFIRAGLYIEVKGVVFNTDNQRIITLPTILTDLRRMCNVLINQKKSITTTAAPSPSRLPSSSELSPLSMHWSICNFTFVKHLQSPVTVARTTIETKSTRVPVDTAQASRASFERATLVVGVVVFVVLTLLIVVAARRRRAKMKDDYTTGGGRHSPKRSPISFTNPAYVARTTDSGVLYPTQRDTNTRRMSSKRSSRLSSSNNSADNNSGESGSGSGSGRNNDTDIPNYIADSRTTSRNSFASDTGYLDVNNEDIDPNENYITVMDSDGISVRGTLRRKSSTGNPDDTVTAVTISNPLFTQKPIQGKQGGSQK